MNKYNFKNNNMFVSSNNRYYLKDYEKKYFNNKNKYGLFSNFRIIKNNFEVMKKHNKIKRNYKYLKIDGSIINVSTLHITFIKRCSRFYRF